LRIPVRVTGRHGGDTLSFAVTDSAGPPINGRVTFAGVAAGDTAVGTLDEGPFRRPITLRRSR
jgi:hypothetical protein